MKRTATEVIVGWQRHWLFSLPEASALIYRDIMLLRGTPSGVTLLDETLEQLDVREVPDRILIGILTATCAIARQLKHRQDFYRRVAGKVADSEELSGLACQEGWEGANSR